MNRRTFWSRIAGLFGIAAAPRALAAVRPPDIFDDLCPTCGQEKKPPLLTRDADGYITHADWRYHLQRDKDGVRVVDSFACGLCGCVDFGGRLDPTADCWEGAWRCEKCARHPTLVADMRRAVREANIITDEQRARVLKIKSLLDDAGIGEAPFHG